MDKFAGFAKMVAEARKEGYDKIGVPFTESELISILGDNDKHADPVEVMKDRVMRLYKDVLREQIKDKLVENGYRSIVFPVWPLAVLNFVVYSDSKTSLATSVLEQIDMRIPQLAEKKTAKSVIDIQRQRVKLVSNMLRNPNTNELTEVGQVLEEWGKIDDLHHSWSQQSDALYFITPGVTGYLDESLYGFQKMREIMYTDIKKHKEQYDM